MIFPIRRIIGINESNMWSINVVDSTTFVGIASVVITAMGSDIVAFVIGVIDVIVVVDGIVGLIGGMTSVVDGFARIFSLNGVVAMMCGVVDIIKGDLFMFVVG